ncbi:MAG TPA: hypothetical protein VLT16_07440 [Candidatus Limnocylindrales bacterium]|nr:hypothetical protein [Candidatus Limnocylindrales bacterium]
MKMQRNRRALARLITACMLLAGCAAYAQSGDGSGDDQANPPQQPIRTNANSYAVSLGTGELISMSGDNPAIETEFAPGTLARTKGADFKNLFFYGFSGSSVYTNNFAGVGATRDLISTSLSPYLAVLVPTRTGSYVAQYTSVVNPNDTSTGDPQAYHTVTLKAEGAFTRRLSWALSGSGSYGSESARLQAPLSYVVVQTTPVGDASSAAVLLRTTNVAFSENRAHLGYLLSSRDSMGVTLIHTYTGIAGDPSSPQATGTHANSAGVKMDYARTISSRFTMLAFGQAYTMLNGLTCNSFGGGLGMSVKVSHSVAFDVQGGPERNSNSCGGQQNANFTANLVADVRGRTKLYASANRAFRAAYRVDGVWEDNASAGFSRIFGRVNLSADAGYLRGQTLLSSTQEYRGYYVSPRLRVKVTDALGFSAGYRTFRGTGGNLVSGNVSFAVASVDWYPSAIHFK